VEQVGPSRANRDVWVNVTCPFFRTHSSGETKSAQEERGFGNCSSKGTRERSNNQEFAKR